MGKADDERRFFIEDVDLESVIFDRPPPVRRKLHTPTVHWERIVLRPERPRWARMVGETLLPAMRKDPADC